MTKQLSALIVVMGYDTVNEDEFHDWYETEHIPERMRVPGFLTKQRYIAVNKEKTFVALYDLSDVNVLHGPDYYAIAHANYSPWSKRILSKVSTLLRYEAVQIDPGDMQMPEGAGGLLVVGCNPKPEDEEEMIRWYKEEHLPGLRSVPGVLSARLYRCTQGPHAFMGVHHVTEMEITKSDAWNKAVETLWTHKVRAKLGERLILGCVPYERFSSGLKLPEFDSSIISRTK